MWSRVSLLLLCLVVALTPAVCLAQAASPSPTGPATPAERPPPIFQYLLAGASLALLVMILCMPTRKSR